MEVEPSTWYSLRPPFQVLNQLTGAYPAIRTCAQTTTPLELTNIPAMQNVAVSQQIWLSEIIGGMILMCQNTVRVYGAWIKT